MDALMPQTQECAGATLGFSPYAHLLNEKTATRAVFSFNGGGLGIVSRASCARPCGRPSADQNAPGVLSNNMHGCINAASAGAALGGSHPMLTC
ncbi:hypothetical protein SAMN02745866_01981 [Alteromonadaceae bacterium Bs31]|nr:hypothetical protein SAMN02745866_01981 [Alteromonadaceae bacterium Bs31]